ncbi:uncharacterized protein LOC126375403 [Pectinophora gossypiella]|uniref:uncharacterized protein LOC126375403 n=1 Tax=Pectinophora gossypiella TaxID=13191 RepID=UPI00214E2233|nr:uncharacterized protein LOC126375403 [Pectinophora gossypiella]
MYTPDRHLRTRRREALHERLESASEHVLAASDVIPAMNPQSSCVDKVDIVHSGLIKKSIASSQRTTSSRVRRKQLELAAAVARAEVVQKRLEYEQARSEHERHSSDHSSRMDGAGSSISGKPAGNITGEHQESAMPAAMTTAAEAARALYDEPVRAPALHPPVDNIIQLAHTLKEMMTTSSSQQEERLLTRLSTPRELPVFSGDCIDWLHFKSAYDESTRICQFSDSENVWRLRRALKGEAKEAVTDLLIGYTSPAVIMEALELRFGNSDLVILQVTSQMRKLAPLPNNYQNDIITFSIKVNNCVATLFSLNQHDYLRSPELAAAIISKLPSILISKWTDYAYAKLSLNIPKLQLLSAFLKREAEMVSVVGVANLRDKRIEPATSSTFQLQRSNKPRPILTTTASVSLCLFCKKQTHLLSECRPFKKAMRKDRWRFVKSKRLCFCCLLERHERNVCPAPVCDIDNCGLAHHRLLHYKKPTDARTQPPAPPSNGRDDEPIYSADEDESPRRETVASVTVPPTPTAPQQGAQGGSGRLPPAPAGVPPSKSAVMLKVVKVHVSGPKCSISTYALLDDGASISMIDKSLVQELGISLSKSNPIKFIDAFGIEVFQADAPKVCTKIRGFHEKQSYNVTLRQVDKLKLPKQDLSIVNDLSCKHLLHIKDIVCKQCVVPRLLIGEDNYSLLAPLELLHGNEREPYATRCRLGWSIHGCYGLTHSSVNGHTFHLSHAEAQEAFCTDSKSDMNIDVLNDLVKKSFELDSIGVSTLKRENTAHLRAVRILDDTARHLAQYIRNKNAQKYQDIHPEAVSVIMQNHYVDDCLHSCSTEAQASRLVSEITSIHKSGGLELQGALLAARLAATIQSEHKDIQPTKRYFWTDSSTVLQWIRSDPRDYKPYVAHRLGEIDELTKSCEWRYVPTGLNVADLATREDASPLTYSSDWFQGPSFLRRPEEQWPRDLKRVRPLDEAMREMRSIMVVAENDCSGLSLPSEDNISTWLTLVRATARVLMFIRRCQRKACQIDTLLMKEAEDLLIKKCQLDSFSSEISCLIQKKELPSNSRLLQLSPFLDRSGMVRVSGRIDRVVGVEYGTRRPAILDGRHRIARLIVEHHHRQALHGANELVVNNLRQNYWIVNSRPTVRTIASQCLFCRYRRAVPQPQRMADLPEARLQHNRRPFSYSGVDFFGPLEVTIGRRRCKRYGMLFTCLTVRAVHIEVTEDLTADSTIMALRRMAARRGMPQVIISDNGTNLRGANAELNRSIAELNTEAVREAGVVRGVDWRFIPPGAPEMGGSWERMIRTVKTSLKVILKERAPHPDTLLTLLAEVEALVNSRPITHVSNDPNYPEALTPNHFLIGTSSTSPQFGIYVDADLCLRRRWRVAQRLTDMFWSRWLKEYLPTLLPRQKWTREARSLQVGDYVILVEPNIERGSWRHGVVSATHAGTDGRVRMVDVRTRTGVLRRPVTRVALLVPQDSSAN